MRNQVLKQNVADSQMDVALEALGKSELSPAWSNIPSDLPERAVALAAELLRTSKARESSAEQVRTAQMARMMSDPPGKAFTIIMTDQILKIVPPDDAAQRLADLACRLGIPRFLTTFDRTLLWAGVKLAQLAPSWVMPPIKRQIHQHTRHVIVSAEPERFDHYFAERVAQGFRINFNQLGEAVLGKREALRRLQSYLDKLQNSPVTYVSVKLSSILSQISLTGYQATLKTIKERLRLLYRAALNNRSGKRKFVNLDMEEYRDLHMTVDVFQQLLDEPEFSELEAGIVLQAYLPDSYTVQQELTEWARRRFESTGAGIKIRLVKGANLAMERVEAALRGWPQAPYATKADVDANFKRMLEFGTRPENSRAVRLGIASHNLFDIAFAMLLMQHRGVADRIEFEMLEGMANAQALEVCTRTGGLVLYTPAVLDEEFASAVAYLVRRLDENTAPGSFLGALFSLQEDSPQWKIQSAAFLSACKRAKDPTLPAIPNRTQNRLTETPQAVGPDAPFTNEPDTDFSLPENRRWIEQIMQRWENITIEPIGLEIAGIKQDRQPSGRGRDPSRPGVQAYRYAEASLEDVDAALSAAVAEQFGWEAVGIAGRKKILREVAAEFARRRGDTIGAMVLDAGKAITEADTEVSEAIDFANYYAQSLDDPGLWDGTQYRARGVVVVTPPWNFPFAIPAGGCLAALMAGNSVILKPSSESVLTGYCLAQQFWAAGVPRDVLQYLPLGDRAARKALIVDPRTAAVILTGSFETARRFQSWRPDLPLYAETSGKNSMIITVHADLDLAVKDLVRGAFGHSGQKCSATSLALVEKSVYENQKFRQQLKDAAGSLIGDGAWNASAVVTPVIRESDEPLRRGLCSLERGETWLLEPRMVRGNPCLWRPGIKLGVRPGSWYHRTECFGPILGLMCVDSFAEALEIQNSNAFGLTGGLQSLDPKEIGIWREKVEVGNAYINRGMTGAIVRRQPFGGWKHSCVGPGAKAGGPNYVATLGRWTQTEPPKFRLPLTGDLATLVTKMENRLDDEIARQWLRYSAESYHYWWKQYFSLEHDPSQVHGETNHFRYRPRPWHLLRIGDINPDKPQTTGYFPKLQIAQSECACRLLGVRLSISLACEPDWRLDFRRITNTDIIVETHEQLIARLHRLRDGTLRMLACSSHQTLSPLDIGNLFVYTTPSLANGRLELLSYCREQSISATIHRYGNIIPFSEHAASR